MPEVTVIQSGGRECKVPLDIEIYSKASELGISVPNLFRQMYGQNADKRYANGDVFAQAMASVGMAPELFRRMRWGELMEGSFQSTITSTEDTRTAVRILAPAAILAMMEENPRINYADEYNMFSKMIAVDTSIANNRFEYPLFDSSNAEEQAESIISQSSTPNIVGQLTVSQKAYSIPTYSYGVEMSYEALKAFTIDQISIYLERLKYRLNFNRMCSQFSAVINGDRDMDMAALPVTSIKEFDSEAGNGVLTHKGYFSWLWSKRRTCRINYILCDLATYFKVIGRKGRPTIVTEPVDSQETQAHPAKPININIYEPQIFILDDGVIPTDTLIGFDSTGAIARVTNSEANYSAVQDIVLRKSKQMRFDFGQVVYRHEDSAWSAVTLH